MSDRILVMRQGRSAGILKREEADAQSLVHLST
jgi:putative xylitol transport system ATP-binding protein